MDQLDHLFMLASLDEVAENTGLVVKAGETPQFQPPPPSMEEMMIRGLLGLDVDTPITEAHLEQARIVYGLPKSE